MVHTTARRGHPIIILYYARWVLVAGIIPILRGLLSVFEADFYFINEGIFLDFIIIGAIALFAVLQWALQTISYNQHSIQHKSGVFFLSSTTLPWKSLTVLKMHQPLYLRPFRAVLLRADAIGGSHRSSDINICVSLKYSNEIIDFYNLEFNQSQKLENYRPSFKSVIALALISINNFVGAFYIVTFISQSGRILGNDFSQMLIGSFETLSRSVSQYIPPAAAALAYFLLFAWIVGVISTSLKYYRYTVDGYQNSLLIHGGLLARHRTIIRETKVNYLSIQQNFISRIIGIYSLFLSAVGCGKERADITCIMPSEKMDLLLENISKLFPKYKMCDPTLRPERRDFGRFIGDPLICFGVDFVLIVAGRIFLSPWKDFITFVGLMALIPFMAFMITRIFDFFSNGIGIEGNTLNIHYSRGFTLYNVLVPVENIVGVKFRSSIFQRSDGNCSLYVYTVSEKGERHYCRNLNYKKAYELLAVIEPMLRAK